MSGGASDDSQRMEETNCSPEDETLEAVVLSSETNRKNSGSVPVGGNSSASHGVVFVDGVSAGTISPGDIHVSEDSALSQQPFGIRFNDTLKSTEQISVSKPAPSAENLPIGTVIGHFEITKYIGGGGMGRVYEARDTALDRQVAIKILPRQRAQDQATVARFFNEARSAARLNHEHIAQVYFCGEENGVPYIAFEYVQGLNLRDYVARFGNLSLDSSIRFLLQISDALAHAANNGVIHRDVKPSNIIITPQKKAKLIDMGLARFLRPGDPDQDLTVSGVTLGTFDYISPEQARDPRQADVRSDIYSLGCTFYFMVTGRPPFPDGTALQKLLQHQGDKAPDVRNFVPDMPASAVAVMQKMMEKDPADRYQRPEDLITALKQVAAQIGMSQEEREELPEKSRFLPKGTKRRIFAYHFPWICAFICLCGWAGYSWQAGEVRKDSVIPPSVERGGVHGLRLVSPAPVSADTELGDPEIPKGDLTAVRLGARRKMQGIESVSNRSLNTVVAFQFPQREYGGIGAAVWTSNDLPNVAGTGELSPESAKLLELTVDAESDLYSGGWSPVHEAGSSGEKVRSESGTPFREGVDPMVDQKGKKDGCYATLEDAFASLAEWNRDLPPNAPRYEIVIRLAFEGDMAVSSLSLADCAVKLVPAPGYSPRLHFDLREMPESGAASLFTLQNASLTISNLPIYFDLPSQEMISDEWTLIRFDSKSLVTLDGTEMSIQNSTEESPAHPNAAFFRMISGSEELNAGIPIASILEMKKGEDAEKTKVESSRRETTAKIRLAKTWIHGDAAFLALRTIRNLRLEVGHSILMTDGSLIHLDEPSASFSPGGPAVDAFFDSVFLWCRAPLFMIERGIPSDLGKEIAASFNRSFLALSGNPVGEIISASAGNSESHLPRWKFSENLLTGVSGLVRYGDSEQTETNGVNSSVSAVESGFGNDNISFDLFLSDNLFWNMTRNELDQVIFKGARGKLDSEIGRQWLDRLEINLPTGVGNTGSGVGKR